MQSQFDELDAVSLESTEGQLTPVYAGGSGAAFYFQPSCDSQMLSQQSWSGEGGEGGCFIEFSILLPCVVHKL